MNAKKNEKLKLNYIIIGELRGRQRSFLEENMLADKAEEKGVNLISLVDAGEDVETEAFLSGFPPEESLLISGDYAELQRAVDCNMATLGYLQREECARIIRDKCVDTSNACDTFVCPDTDMWTEGFEEIDLEFLIHVYERHHGLPWTILETKRCVVREFSMDYLDDLFELYAGKGMVDYVEPLYSYEEEREYQEAYIRNMYGFYGYGMWIVCDRNTGELIGRAGLEHREELDGEMELGYAIGVPYQRQGYATEVCEAILEYAHKELEQTSLCCLIEEGNHVSEHLARKLGFALDGTIQIGGKSLKKYVCSF